MAYVALKPCCFAGHHFKIGDGIPDDLIHPGAAKNLIKMGVVANAENHSPIVPTGNIAITHGDMCLEISPDGMQQVVDVLSGKASDAETTIKQMNDVDALILLHLCESRKTVRDAAEERASEISEEAGEE